MSAYILKVGDTLPPIQTVLGDAAGGLDLTGYTVRFQHDERGGRDGHRRGGHPRRRCARIFQYQWHAGDTDVIGVYAVDWVVVGAGGATRTFSNSGFDRVEIVKRVPPKP